MRPLTGALRTPRLVGRGGVAREAALLPALLDSRPVAPAPGCHTPFALFLEGKPVLPAAPLLGLSWHVLQARPWAPTPRAARLLTFLPPSPPPRSSLQAPRPASVLSHRCSDSSGGACFWWVRGGGWVEAEEHQSCSAAASGALPTPELAWTTLDLPCTFAHCVCFLESRQPQGQMGNSKSHPGQERSSRFLPTEQAEVNRLFDALSSEKLGSCASPRSFSLQALKGHVGDALPSEMVTRLFEGMRRVDGSGKAKGPSERVSQEQFTASMSHLLKGTAEEKSLVILNMISASGGPVKARDVHKFTEDLVGSVVHVLNYRRQLRGWSQKPPPGSPSRVQVLAAQLCSEMRLQGGGKLLGPQWLDRDCDRAVLEDWVFRAHHVATFLSLVIHQGFLLLRSSLELATLVPERQVDPQREFASILDVLSVIYINSHLPQERRLRWRLLFATELHGNSFAQLCGRIAHGGPCLVLLEDCDGHVFGGFASCSWEVKPQFQGDDRCFLFSISPSMAVYTCTGYNDHYMYLNQGQQTIPNGLGMGGQHGYFGLWIDVDFGKGHSKAKPTCTTYGSPQLSAQEDFQFQKMEVWAVGDAPKAEPVRKTRSILDIDPEARALLEASGRGRHSEGLREVPDEQ